MTRLSVEIASLRLDNPTMLASGILGTTGPILERIIYAGAGAVVTKSVGLKARGGYPNPTVVQSQCGMLNAVGLPTAGVHHFAEEIRHAKRPGKPVIVSVYGFSSEEFAEVSLIATRAGADALELNVSCPHVKETGAEIGQNPNAVTEVVKSVKDVTSKPVFVKLTPNVADVSEIAKAAVKAGADAITAINAVKAISIDIESMRPVLGNLVGGLSGPAIKPIAIRCVFDLYPQINVPVIGCGGVTTWIDAIEFFLAGATAVQIGTAVAVQGLGIFKAVTKGVDDYLKCHGFESVRDIVGISHQK